MAELESPELSPLDRKEARLNALLRGLVFVVVALLVANTTLSALIAVQDHRRIQQNEKIQTFIKDQAIANGRMSRRNQEVLREVRSCTQPGGACYKRGQEATGSAVASINTITIAAAACAVVVDRSGSAAQIEDEIKLCVQQRLGVNPR